MKRILPLLLAAAALPAQAQTTRGAAAQAAPPPSGVAAIVGVKFTVRDVPASVAFYNDVFGFDVARTLDATSAGRATEVVLVPHGRSLASGGPALTLKQQGSVASRLPAPRGQIAVLSFDADSVAARAVARRAHAQHFSGGITVVRDIDGNEVEILSAQALAPALADEAQPTTGTRR